MAVTEKRPGMRLIFVRTIRTRSGKVLVAPNYGLKAFPIWVKDEPKN